MLELHSHLQNKNKNKFIQGTEAYIYQLLGFQQYVHVKENITELPPPKRSTNVEGFLSGVWMLEETSNYP